MDKCVFKLGKYYLASELDCEEARVSTEISEASIFNLTKNIDDWEEEITAMIENGFMIVQLTENNVTNEIVRELNNASKTK